MQPPPHSRIPCTHHVIALHPLPPALAALICFCLWICLFWIFHRNGSTHYMAFCVWFLSLSIVFCFRGSDICVLVFHVFLWLNNTPLNGWAVLDLFIPWWTLGLFPPLGCSEELWTFVNFLHWHMFSFLVDVLVCLGLKLLGHGNSVYIFEGPPNFFSFSILTSNVQGF